MTGEVMTQEDIEWIFEQAGLAKRLVTIGDKHRTPAEFKMFANEPGRVIEKSSVKLTDPFELINRGKQKLYSLMSRQLMFEEKIDSYMKGHIK